MSRSDVSLREVLLADMYEKELDMVRKDAAILREALERIAAGGTDCCAAPLCVDVARGALQRAGGGE